MKSRFWYMISGWFCVLLSILLFAVSMMRNADAAIVTGDKIELDGKILSLEQTSDTKVDAGQHVKKYGQKLFYGHNLPEVFGGLKNLEVGENFTVTESEILVEYKVAEVVTFNKVSSEVLELNNQKYAMSAIADYAWGHDAVLMTCAGESYGDGDATQRLVVFADRVE